MVLNDRKQMVLNNKKNGIKWQKNEMVLNGKIVT